MTATPNPTPEQRAAVRAVYDAITLAVCSLLETGESDGVITAEQSAALLAIFDRPDTEDEICRTWRGVMR